MKAIVYKTWEEFEAAGPGAIGFEFLIGEKNKRGINFKCPCCGEIAYLPTSGHPDEKRMWTFDEETLTVTPSILWTSGCKWHGYLTNGEWIKC